LPCDGNSAQARASGQKPGAAVGTLDEFRRRGYATRVVAFVTAYILAPGRVATCSTDEDNVAMRATARRVGFQEGPLIGLRWEQERCPGRGDVRLRYNNCFTMELSVTDHVPGWGDQEVTMSVEQDVAFTEEGCRPIDGRQAALYLIQGVAEGILL